MPDNDEIEMTEPSKSREPICPVTFNYDIIMECEIEGRTYELHKIWNSPTQLGKGDLFFILAFSADVRVKRVVWFLNRSGHGLITLTSQKLDGKPTDWIELLEDFDYSCPELTKKFADNPQSHAAL